MDAFILQFLKINLYIRRQKIIKKINQLLIYYHFLLMQLVIKAMLQQIRMVINIKNYQFF